MVCSGFDRGRKNVYAVPGVMLSFLLRGIRLSVYWVVVVPWIIVVFVVVVVVASDDGTRCSKTVLLPVVIAEINKQPR